MTTVCVITHLLWDYGVPTNHQLKSGSTVLGVVSLFAKWTIDVGNTNSVKTCQVGQRQVSQEHIGPRILAKIQIYILTRAKFTLQYVLPTEHQSKKSDDSEQRLLLYQASNKLVKFQNKLLELTSYTLFSSTNFSFGASVKC